MAEHGEIAAGAGAIGAFLGGLWAALKWRKPSNGDDDMAVRMAEFERRINDHDKRLDQHENEIAEIFRALSTCTADVREALTRLQERRKG